MKNLSEIHKPIIMGIVNVTPDSFSDGGKYFSPDYAINHGIRLLNEGAQILDIGGESTRPNAESTPVEEELKRIIPVIKGLRDKAGFISVDTRNSAVMKESISCGANFINDISALTHDPNSVKIVAEHNVYICLMHMQGTPQTMQIAPKYKNVTDEVKSFLSERIDFCLKNKINAEKIILDVGIGFGKTLEHNLTLLKNLRQFREFGFPILLGTSRKSFIPGILGKTVAPDQRIGGSLASVIWGAENGIDIFRVHDVTHTSQALKVYQAIREEKS